MFYQDVPTVTFFKRNKCFIALYNNVSMIVFYLDNEHYLQKNYFNTIFTLQLHVNSLDAESPLKKSDVFFSMDDKVHFVLNIPQLNKILVRWELQVFI